MSSTRTSLSHRLPALLLWSLSILLWLGTLPGQVRAVALSPFLPYVAPQYGQILALAGQQGPDFWTIGQDVLTLQTSLLHTNSATLVWEIARTPFRAGQATYLGLASVSAHDVWAVGYQVVGGLPRPLAMHWNGQGWQVVPLAAQETGRFTQVLGLGATDVWTLGEVESVAGGRQPLVERWNGQMWQQMAVPVPVGESVSLSALSGDSAADVWASGVGVRADGSVEGVVEHWNGLHWQRVPIPSQISYLLYTGGMAQLDMGAVMGIAVVSTGNVWVVDTAEDQTGAATPVLLHWTQGQWTAISTSGGIFGPVGVTVTGDHHPLSWDGTPNSIDTNNFYTDGSAAFYQVNGATLQRGDSPWHVGNIDESVATLVAFSLHDLWMIGALYGTGYGIPQPVLFHVG